MLKDEQNCSYNGGGDAKPLKIWSDFSSMQYYQNSMSNPKTLKYSDIVRGVDRGSFVVGIRTSSIYLRGYRA